MQENHSWSRRASSQASQSFQFAKASAIRPVEVRNARCAAQSCHALSIPLGCWQVQAMA